MKSEWLKKGYDPGTLAHRLEVLKIVKKYAPFESLLDVGCASGVDLCLFEMAWDKAKLVGFDKAPENVAEAKGKGLKADIYLGSLENELLEIPDKSFDIVFSNGVIMYTDAKWVHEMMRIARKAVILSEKEPYNGFTFDSVRHLFTNTTKITEDVRHSWANDGYIYEIAL